MAWHPDVPDLPIRKPKKIEQLEKTDPAILEAMPRVEVDDTVEDIAHAVAVAYKKQVKNCHYEECIEVVSVALKVTGSSLGGQVGKAMIAANEKSAIKACSLVFTKETSF